MIISSLYKTISSKGYLLQRVWFYRFFIKTQLSDTISTSEAEVLKKFFSSGSALEAYNKNRTLLLARSAFMQSQRDKLRSDLAEGIMDELDVKVTLDKEVSASRELSAIMLEQQKKYYSAILEFKQALPLLEEFIRKHNMNELPALIKEKQDF